eukprot:g5477.t1
MSTFFDMIQYYIYLFLVLCSARPTKIDPKECPNRWRLERSMIEARNSDLGPLPTPFNRRKLEQKRLLTWAPGSKNNNTVEAVNEVAEDIYQKERFVASDRGGRPRNVYVFTRDIKIAKGATLKIFQGVQIFGRGYTLTVEGDLHLMGSKSRRIIVENLHIVTTHSISKWRESVHDDEEIGKNSFNTAPILNFRFASFVGGSLLPRGRTSFFAPNIRVRDCEFENMPAIYIGNPKQEINIERNLFVDSAGIRTGQRAVQVSIVNNTFLRTGWKDGWNKGFITNYLQEPQTDPEYDAVHMKVHGNNFFCGWNFDKNSKVNCTALSLDLGYEQAKMPLAQNNYFNGTDATAENIRAAGYIFDKKNTHLIQGEIIFAPSLRKKSSGAPIIPFHYLRPKPKPLTYWQVPLNIIKLGVNYRKSPPPGGDLIRPGEDFAAPGEIVTVSEFTEDWVRVQYSIEGKYGEEIVKNDKFLPRHVPGIRPLLIKLEHEEESEDEGLKLLLAEAMDEDKDAALLEVLSEFS